ncbi:MAG: outer membrane beta-barrel protein [Bacteroidales bacterium]|nr:outer membrane beta-barrel protein [Bacteroidales bacterium]
MSSKILSVFCILFIFNTITYSQIFEDEQKFEIRDSSLVLLKKYVKYADLTEDGISISENYEAKFLSLFTEDAFVVNDLLDKRELISPEYFVKMIKEKYEGGIEVRAEIDSAYFKNLKKVEENIYSVQVDCRKFTIGLNNQNKLVRKDITATFTIHFKYKDETLSDFQIKEIISNEIILQRHSDKKMKGLYLGVNVNALAGRLFSDNNIRYYNREYKLSGAFSAGISADYCISSNYAVSIGIDYCSFNSNFNTKYNNEMNNNLPGTDIDNDNYYLYVNSDFTEKNSLKYVSIPVKFKYRHKLYDDISFFASASFSTSFLLSSDSYINGSSVHSAWYEEYNLFVDDAELYNLGEHNYDEAFDLSVTELFFSGIFEVGVSIPVKESSFLNVGAKLDHSFSDLAYNTSSYRDDYINLHGAPKSLFIQSGGIFISYLFKL